jgi:hypothetical protein
MFGFLFMNNYSPVILLLSAISVIPCGSFSSSSIFDVYLPHFEHTITFYEDVVANAPTILKVSNPDGTLIVDCNASAVQSVLLIEFAKISNLRITLSARLHRKPVLGTLLPVESGDDFCYLLTIFKEIPFHSLHRKSFYLLLNTSIC